MEGAASLGSRGFGAGVLAGWESLEVSWVGVLEGELHPARSARVMVNKATSIAVGRQGWCIRGLSVG